MEYPPVGGSSLELRDQHSSTLKEALKVPVHDHDETAHSWQSSTYRKLVCQQSLSSRGQPRPGSFHVPLPTAIVGNALIDDLSASSNRPLRALPIRLIIQWELENGLSGLAPCWAPTNRKPGRAWKAGHPRGIEQRCCNLLKHGLRRTNMAHHIERPHVECLGQRTINGSENLRHESTL